jgi:hypothetical protein
MRFYKYITLFNVENNTINILENKLINENKGSYLINNKDIYGNIIGYDLGVEYIEKDDLSVSSLLKF